MSGAAKETYVPCKNAAKKGEALCGTHRAIVDEACLTGGLRLRGGTANIQVPLEAFQVDSCKFSPNIIKDALAETKAPVPGQMFNVWNSEDLLLAAKMGLK
jgi:hypothetical protein